MSEFKESSNQNESITGIGNKNTSSETKLLERASKSEVLDAATKEVNARIPDASMRAVILRRSYARVVGAPIATKVDLRTQSFREKI